MRVFFIVWSGQLVSLIGSGPTGFALGVWLYQQTGSVTLFALNALFFTLPRLLMSPIAGALVDRWDRRWVMILSDAGAGLSTLFLVLLLISGRLEIWHVYVAAVVNAVFNAFQWPAYSAATTLLVPKAQLGRAAGLVQIGEAISQLVAPAAAGMLLVTIGLEGVMAIDLATALFAISTLLIVRFPRPKSSAEGAASRGSLLHEAAFGWKYIRARSGLLELLTFFAFTNFLWGILNPLLFPTFLEMTTADVLGLLASIVGVGMLLGTLVMSVWGGPQRRILGVLAFALVQGVLAVVLGLRPSIAWMTAAGFGILFCMPIVNGSSQALWQSKVEPDFQGRVFAIRRMIAMAASPLAYIVVGPLADGVFEPLMAVDGPLAETVGRVIGTGPGRGAALMFIIIGVLIAGAAASAYLSPRIRLIEDELPDVIGNDALQDRAAHEVAKEPRAAPVVAG
jgi:MFS family permease